jgi:hypothetical protein
MDPTDAELKLTIAKLIEVAYSKQKGVTTNIVLGSERFKLTMNESGHATLSSKVGIVTFDGSRALEKIGLSVKSLDINFWTEDEDRQIRYTASYGIKVASRAVTTLSVSGSFNIQESITACSALLCQAACYLKGFDSNVDAQMQSIMGQ